MLSICGPKLSICCSIISAWGIIMLILMGIFAYTGSPAFAEDLGLNEGDFENITKVNEAYKQVAYNCWIASGLYVLSLIFSVQQYFSNSRQGYQV